MNFTSPSFLFLFLPTVIFLYAVTQNHLKKHALLVFNIVFYVFFNIREPIVVILLFLCMLYTYVAGREIRFSGKRSVLVSFVLLEIIAFFAYRVFLVRISSGGVYFFFSGASFILLSSVSYMCDVYRKDADPNLSFFNMATYISYFPTVIAGPIVRYKNFLFMLEEQNFSIDNFSSGVIKFCSGFIKKVVIAATLTETLSIVLPLYSMHATVYSLLFVAAIFFLKVLFELWGYSDMAEGIALILGYRLRDNFKNPVAACGVGDFFGRFFVSLKEWIHDYIYRPLCKKGKRVNVLSVFVSCIFAALWFKTNFVMLCAGIIFALCICAEKYFSFDKLVKKSPVLRVVLCVFTIVFMSLMFFAMRANSPVDVAKYISRVNLAQDVSHSYFVYTSLADLKFIFAMVTVLAFFVQPKFERAVRSGFGDKVYAVYILTNNLLLLIVFAFAIIYFLPQFPEYFSLVFDFTSL